MTRKKDIEKTKVFLTNFFIISSVFFISVFYMPYIAKFINDGLQLCRKTIIASVFPFMIFTDLIISFCRFNTSEKLKNLFSYIFKINGSGITAFICGNVCGAPMGIKCAVMLYNNGSISKSECERLIGISNNTSPSFAIGGIGGLIRGSIKDGVIVYISVLLASIFTGWFFGLGKSTSKTTKDRENFKFSFPASVKNAAQNTVIICGFVTVFSIIVGALESVIKSDVLYSILVSFLEVGNAASVLSSANFSGVFSLSFTTFAVAFSGISIHMQAASFVFGSGISMKKYYQMKLFEGVSAFIISFFIYYII